MASGNSHSNDAKFMGFVYRIFPGHLQAKEFMIIPSSFERKHKITLPNPVILRLPNNGAEWQVSWTKHDYDIRFQQDWKKFAQDCSLRDPQFLSFEYEGGSHFVVRIFDEVGDDIDYSSIRCTNGAITTNHCDDDDEAAHINNFIQINSDDSAGCETQTQLPKKRKTNTNGEHRSDTSPHCKTKIIKDCVATQQKVSAGARRGGRSMMVKANSRTKAAIPKQKKSAMQQAMDYQNKTKEPSFIRTLHPSYLGDTRDLLVINGHFAKEHLGDYEGNATIRVPNNHRTWSVSIKKNHSNGQTNMNNGWKSFWQDNKLELDHVCVFVMTERSPLSFKVVIFTDIDETDDEELPGHGGEANQDSPKRRPMEKGRYFESSGVKEKKFEICIRKYHMKDGPNLPKGFMDRYPRLDGNDVQLKVGEKSWRVKVIRYGSYARFSAGWRRFAKECELLEEDGKMMEFEMIDEVNLVIKVSVS
ncbi:hypothetical protein RIF29_14719 [Crotalaria pallida]|uniref:TF-B3 domain-containing protein n=1 Tax=Crotalaria pallida TaxID=3830 RepID=A0AAN9FFX4_CROPI